MQAAVLWWSNMLKLWEIHPELQASECQCCISHSSPSLLMCCVALQEVFKGRISTAGVGRNWPAEAGSHRVWPWAWCVGTHDRTLDWGKGAAQCIASAQFPWFTWGVLFCTESDQWLVNMISWNMQLTRNCSSQAAEWKDERLGSHIDLCYCPWLTFSASLNLIILADILIKIH